MLAEGLQQEVEQALQERRFFQLRELLSDLEAPDAASAIETLEEDDKAIAFRVLRRDQAADVFEYLESESQ